MIRWIQKKSRTRTKVHSQSQAAAERRRSRAAALRSVAAVQTAAQVLLWVPFSGYDGAVQAVWQAALMLALPLAALWLTWRSGERAAESRTGSRIALALLPCLWLDAAFLLYAMTGLIDYFIPEYPYAAGTAAAAAVCWLTVLTSRRSGVAYGTSALKVPLILTFLLGTVFLHASSRADRLWPILGKGLAQTALTALNGTGSLWGAALLFLLPGRMDRPTSLRSSGWAWAVWMAGVLWALWFGFLHPWAPGDALSTGERLMGLARHAGSVVNYSLAGLMWMLLLPLSLTGNISAGEVLVRRVWPQLPRTVAVLIVPLPALLALLLFPAQLPDMLGLLLPWRGAWSLLAGLAMDLAARKEERR